MNQTDLSADFVSVWYIYMPLKLFSKFYGQVFPFLLSFDSLLWTVSLRWKYIYVYIFYMGPYYILSQNQ